MRLWPLLLVPLVAATCPKEQVFGSNCYSYANYQDTFEGAEAYCATVYGGHLTSVQNAFENNFLKGIIPSGNTDVWIGARRPVSSKGNDYTWTDGSLFTYSNIDGSSMNSGEVLYRDQNGKWIHSQTSAKLNFICKYPTSAPTTPYQDAAAYLLSSVDTSADPCNDFYQFTCGTFLKNHPPGQQQFSNFDIGQSFVNKQINDFLETVTSSSSLTERVTKIAYEACQYNYENTNPSDKAQLIYNEIKGQFGGIPFMQSNQWNDIPNSKFWSGVGYFERQHAMGTLMFSWASTDTKNISRNALSIDQANLQLPRDYYVKPQFLNKIEAHVASYKQLIQLFGSHNQVNIGDTAATKVANDIVNFEIQLALASWPGEEQRNFKQMYNPYKLSALQIAYPNISWKEYFDQLFAGIGQDSSAIANDEVIIDEPSYFGWLNSVFGGKQFSQSTILNYIALQAVSDSADFIAGDFMKWADKYNQIPYMMRRGKGLTGVGARKERKKFDFMSDMCLDILMAYMPYGPGYVYVKSQGQNRDPVIADVKVEIEYIVESFKDMIASLNWMSFDSKQKAYDKASALIRNVGWPAWFGNFQDATAVDAYHIDYAPIAKMDKTQYFDILLLLKQGMEVRESTRLLSQPADRSNFLQSPAMVNAWYQPDRNSITFPYAAFNTPYYNLKWPQAFNYGGQGGTGGHELTHGYDDEGVQFGPDGSLSDCDSFHCGWMDSNSTTGFINMAQCVVTQFSTQCCPVKSGNVHCANGATTQGENIADLGGQQAAYRAYRKWVAHRGTEESRLPGLEQFSPDQIFWITYGASWCSNPSQSSLVRQCVVTQFSTQCCPVKSGNVHCANGATTQGENIADLGGQQAAYRAYRKWVAHRGTEESRLPGLEQFSPDQIFWITYGASWCSNPSQSSLVRQLMTDVHSPSVCRTNNVLQDIPAFGNDFQCLRGSPMFPKEACTVWVGK